MFGELYMYYAYLTKNLIASAFGHSLLYFRKYLCTYVKTNFGKGKTWKRRGLIVSHLNYDGLVRRLFVVLCVHEVRAMVQQEDSSSIFLLQTSRKSKYIRYFLSQKYWQNKQLSAIDACFNLFQTFHQIHSMKVNLKLF